MNPSAKTKARPGGRRPREMTLFDRRRIWELIEASGARGRAVRRLKAQFGAAAEGRVAELVAAGVIEVLDGIAHAAAEPEANDGSSSMRRTARIPQSQQRLPVVQRPDRCRDESVRGGEPAERRGRLGLH